MATGSAALTAKLYQTMLLIREVEQHIVDVYFTDVIKSPVHLSIGQEAIAAAVCEPLNKDDMISNTYRCHATHIAKGGDLNAMMAELYGKRDGCAGGKAGSMHLIDIANGVIGASAVVGTTVPVAAGYALALKRAAATTGQQRVVVCMFGDGATEEGSFLETINFAAIHTLPILFVCENNGLAIHAPLSKRWATEKLCERIRTYDIPTNKIESGDVFEIRDAVEQNIRNIRAGQGPAFMECHTYRWLEHVGPLDDHDAAYRNKAALEESKKNDQIARLSAMLDDHTRKQIHSNVAQQLEQAITFARNSTFPDTTEELYQHVYAN